MNEDVKLVRLKEATYYGLKDVKFELRVDTFDEAVKALLEEHKDKSEDK